MVGVMADLGFSAKQVVQAETGNFGVGKRELIIQQAGNDIAINAKFVSGQSFAQHFTVGQGSQKTQGLNGGACMVDADWVDRRYTLRVHSTPLGSTTVMEPVREYFKEGNQLVCQLTSKHGHTARLFYCKTERMGLQF
jgi:hypothetical protein